ncbi:hypothetical protein Naga_100911g2 [Nannochloropsis gaditana]|uniref:Uncharacterized protein n=1 Tax=Nannochloropsis gaditana TaxID=72520 RepID=W7TVQ4_9STRA|nr:hypothetical protein Naga_100911g2 [Nannochloropsis gaditana]
MKALNPILAGTQDRCDFFSKEEGFTVFGRYFSAQLCTISAHAFFIVQALHRMHIAAPKSGCPSASMTRRPISSSYVGGRHVGAGDHHEILRMEMSSWIVEMSVKEPVMKGLR